MPAPLASTASHTGGNRRDPSVHVDKKVRRHSRKRPHRDRLFSKMFNDLRETRGVAGSAASTVSGSAMETKSSKPSPLDACEGISVSSDIRATRLKPAQWRDLSDTSRAPYLHKALKSLGDVYAVSLNLGDDIISDAYAAGSFLVHVRRRIARHLEQALGRKVSFWLTLEETFDVSTKRHRPHLHGELQISAAQAATARNALRKAGGEWKLGARQKQVKFRLNPDFGWSSYANKDAAKAMPLMRKFLRAAGAGPRWVLSFDGRVMTATNDLKAKAKKLYETDRALAFELMKTGQVRLTRDAPDLSKPIRDGLSRSSIPAAGDACRVSPPSLRS